MSFAQVPGHQAAKDIMKQAIENRRISHAYLITGAQGIGKKALALEFARAIFCQQEKSDSCDSCLVCRKIEHRNHPDLKILTGETIKIDQVRELQGEIAYKPYESNWKIYIIDNADQMTPQAANSLLKTLEEPPDYAVIILLASEVSRLLPTIISRCQRIKLATIPRQQIKQQLLKNDLVEEKAELYSRLAAGSLRRARKLSQEEEFFEQRGQIIDFLLRLPDLDTVQLFDRIGMLEDNLDNDYPVFNLLSDWYRDIMLYSNNREDLITNYDYLEKIEKQANRYSQEELQGIIQLIFEYQDYINRNIRMDLVLEVMFLKIRAKRV